MLHSSHYNYNINKQRFLDYYIVIILKYITDQIYKLLT